MDVEYDIIIAGGGLSGLTAAILFSKDYNVLCIDPESYPRHKMCGEYLSNEVMDFLRTLDIDLDQESSIDLEQLNFTTTDSKQIKCNLPQGGKGISRYHLDHLLFKKASLKATFIEDKVLDSNTNKDTFTVTTSRDQFTCKQFIMATGKRSILDKKLERDFMKYKSPWLAVKMHYQYDMPDNLVELHNFKGGYAGISKVENGHVNLCYLASYKSFKEHKNVADFNTAVLSKNKHLASFLDNATPVWEQPITISQISFEKKLAVERHILMLGDTAGLIHPLCGNGMAMAIHSAQIAFKSLEPFLRNQISRDQSLSDYSQEWNKTFRKRLWIGRLLQGILLNKTYTSLGLWFLSKLPFLLPIIIKKTHGKPI